MMERGLQAKFSQNAELKKYILKTGNKTLTEAKEHDTFCACGWPLSTWVSMKWVDSLSGLIFQEFQVYCTPVS